MDQDRDERGRFAANGGPSQARAERVRLNKEADARRYGTRPWDRPTHGVGASEQIARKVSNDTGKSVTPEAVQAAVAAGYGAHSVGVHLATAGKTLAEASAAGTNQSFGPPKIPGE
jgi:type II secretory pathway component HofQ